MKYVIVINYAPHQEQEELRLRTANIIQETLESPDISAQKIAVELISHAAKSRRTELIAQALKYCDISVMQSAAYNISETSLENQKKLKLLLAEAIRPALQSPDISAQKMAIDLIWHLNPDQRQKLFKIVFQTCNIAVQAHAAECMSGLGEYTNNQLQNMLAKAIWAGLNNADTTTQKTAAGMMAYIPKEKRAELKKYIQNRPMLMQTLATSSLYVKTDVSATQFQRAAFAKSGSETTLLGSSLKGKVVLRHIEPECFMQWQKAYEHHQFWREQGFDYVPIEPILSFHSNEKGLVDVASGVLDTNFEHYKFWGNETIVKNLEQQRNKIFKAVQQLIEHGHPHEGNFCLRFFRDEQGMVDHTKTPRLYLIDFDRAGPSVHRDRTTRRLLVAPG